MSATLTAAESWLLQSDPAIRWQVMRDLTDASAADSAAERERVATEGAGGQLLSLQDADGQWGSAAWNHGWNSTMHALTLLRELGVDPHCVQVRRAVELVRRDVTWKGCDGDSWDGNRYFDGEVEPCINGQVAASAAYLKVDVSGIVARLLAEQLTDGGWNCDAERGSTRSSFNTTINVLEALLEYERSFGATADVTAARLRGEEFLLERRLFRRKSTGEIISRDRRGETDFTQFAFPTWWHYDVLRSLDFLRNAGAARDARMADAIELVESKRGDDGRWLLDVEYPGTMLVALNEGVGAPSRWITLRAMRVLKWYAHA